jgi:hypothetical protein
VPHNRHGKAVLVIVTNAPIPGPQLFRPRHPPTMQTVRNVCNWALEEGPLVHTKAAMLTADHRSSLDAILTPQSVKC